MRRRILWLAHFIYWLRVHRDISRALWVMQFEGKVWK